MRGSEIDIVHQNTVRSYRVSEQDKIVSYTRTRQDRIVHENKTRSYRTREQDKIVSYTRTRQDRIVHENKTRSYRTWASVEGRKERKGNAAVRHVCVVMVTTTVSLT